jgi:hypothetical protein
MNRSIAVVFLLALACHPKGSSPKKRGENEVPESVIAATAFCYKGEPSRDRINIVKGLEAPPGLELWKVCPCQPQVCYVVGTDEQDRLVPSDDVVLRLLKFTGPEHAGADARLALDILAKPKPTADAPREVIVFSKWTGQRLEFLVAAWDLDKKAHVCRKFVVDVEAKKIERDDMTPKYGDHCQGSVVP